MEHHVENLKSLSATLARFRQGSESKLRDFRREEGGSLIIFSLFMFILLLMISGMAVDLMRAETQRARLQSTLDRAVLAGASLDQALDSEDVVRDYFEKAGLSAYLTDVGVVAGLSSKTVEATAFMEVDSFFMHMMGIDSLDVPAAGTAQESLSDIEISLVLDVSGSMGRSSSSGQDKIDDLIDAASDFVVLMQCNPDPEVLDEFGDPTCTVEANTVSISLVPYAEQVLVGEDLIQEFNVTDEHTESACADFTTNDFLSTSISLSDTLQRTGNHDARSRSSDSTAGDSNRTCRTHDYRKILPLSNDWEELQAQIQAMNAGGYTSIDLAMKWGVALLDPAFRPVVANLAGGMAPSITPDFADRPYDFTERNMQKVVVLMTDGVNTSQYELKPAYRDGPSPFWYNIEADVLSVYQDDTDTFTYEDGSTGHDIPYGDGWGGSYYTLTDEVRRCSGRGWRRTCWWETTTTDVYPTGVAGQMTYPEVWQKYPTKYFDAQPGMRNPVTYNASNKNNRLDTICSAAKAQDVEVFTIGFETSSSSSAVMRSCATSIDHHFDATGLNLDNAFASIAREIHELRLTH